MRFLPFESSAFAANNCKSSCEPKLISFFFGGHSKLAHQAVFWNSEISGAKGNCFIGTLGFNCCPIRTTVFLFVGECRFMARKCVFNRVEMLEVYMKRAEQCRGAKQSQKEWSVGWKCLNVKFDLVLLYTRRVFFFFFFFFFLIFHIIDCFDIADLYVT